MYKSKEVCNWFAAGFCKHADKCSLRGAACADAWGMRDMEDLWLAEGGAHASGVEAGDGAQVECVVVVDIEGGANDRAGEDEIIELPVVLVNLKTRREEARFHRFVRPSSWDSLLQGAPRARINALSSAVPFPQAGTFTVTLYRADRSADTVPPGIEPFIAPSCHALTASTRSLCRSLSAGASRAGGVAAPAQHTYSPEARRPPSARPRTKTKKERRSGGSGREGWG